jgi:hypothetical protein
MPSAPPPVDASYAEKIKWLREDSEDYPKCLTEPTPKNDTKDVERAVEELKVSELSEEEQIEAIGRNSCISADPDRKEQVKQRKKASRRKAKMPSHPAEETTGGSMYFYTMAPAFTN